jgi:hypothetical protein
MTEELEGMCRNISLTEGEKVGIMVTEGEVAEIKERGANCLVGKLWTEKGVNKEAFKTVLSRLWRTAGRVAFKEFQENCWLFEFAGEDDKRRVLEGRPWSYDRYALVLNDFDGNTPPSLMQFQHTPIWIQVHDLPLLCMNRGVGTKIGASLGEIVDVDMAGDGAGWGRCLRLRVVIDIFKPLERGRALNFGGKSHWINFKYEKLPLFCFQCGCIVHERKFCPDRKSQRIHTDEGEKQWGSWLRAEVPKKERQTRYESGGWFKQSGENSASDGGRRGDSSPDKGSCGHGGQSRDERPRGSHDQQSGFRTYIYGNGKYGTKQDSTLQDTVGSQRAGGESEKDDRSLRIADSEGSSHRRVKGDVTKGTGDNCNTKGLMNNEQVAEPMQLNSNGPDPTYTADENNNGPIGGVGQKSDGPWGLKVMDSVGEARGSLNHAVITHLPVPLGVVGSKKAIIPKGWKRRARVSPTITISSPGNNGSKRKRDESAAVERGVSWYYKGCVGNG